MHDNFLSRDLKERMAPNAPYRTCAVTDRFSMWVDTMTMACTTISYQDVWRKFGVMDVEWRLGGEIDGRTAAFVQSQVNVIRGDS